MQEENVEEVWRDVVGYVGLYKVSSLGRVKSLPRSFIRKGGKPMKLKERILKPNPIKGGYYQFKFTVLGVEKNLLLHRIVCEAFNGPAPADKPHVNHIDTNKDNNSYLNLEWVSFQENMSHAALHGLRPRGSGNHMHKIEEAEVLEICDLIDKGEMSNNDIADKYGVNHRTISSIKYGKSWNWLTKRRT